MLTNMDQILWLSLNIHNLMILR